ncbi:unnamed protein product [Rhizophagus irregularis]|nr:unnamed protein product [Rhizophagus irregularis]
MNLSEDWYQTAIKKFKINEILYKKFSGKPTRIGRGGFGLIYKTECNSIGTVAIKEITLGIEDDEICIKNFINELKIHSRIKHDRIIQFHGISRNIDEGLYYLVLDLGMVLWEISSCQPPFNGEDLACLSLMICGGLKEKSVKGTPMEYKQIYTSCWEIEPNSRPLIEGVLSRLISMLSEYSNNNNVPFPTIPDDLTLPTNDEICKRCDSEFIYQNWCYNCEAQEFQKKFSNWTSENESLDELIQYSQLSAIKNDTYFEWINFNRFKKREIIMKGELFAATWLDGSRELWDNESQRWKRTGPVRIILRRLRYITINKLKLYLELKNIIICCYGFTQDPKTKYYYIVLKYANGRTLQQYIQNKFSLSWFKRLSILKKIAELLHNIHKTNYVHGNLHSGSILLQEDDLNNKLEIYVSDLDLCIYSDYKVERKFYETYKVHVINNRHVSPEISKGEIVSIKSDIYSFGVLMRELSSRNGPQCYDELKQKCLYDDPERRPDTKDLLYELRSFTVSPLKKRQFEVADSRDIPFYQQLLPFFPLLQFYQQPLPPFLLPPFYQQPLPYFLLP